MSKVTIDQITAGYLSQGTINDNFTAVQDALENTLSRDGTRPNDMQAPLDMGGFRIENLGAPLHATDAVRVIDIETGTVVVSPTITWDDITSLPTTVFELGEMTLPGGDFILYWDDTNSIWAPVTLGPSMSFTGGELDATTSGVDWTAITSIPALVTSLGLLVDPNADRILFWDDSQGNVKYLTASTGLSISGTTLSVDLLGIQALSDPNADRVFFWDDSAGAAQFLTMGTGLSITGTTLNVDTSSISVTFANVTSQPVYISSIGALTDPNADRILFWDDSAGGVANLAPDGVHLSISGTNLNFNSLTGSATVTLTGVTGTVTGTLKYSKVGDIVTVEIPDLTGTSNSTAHTVTGLPGALTPTNTQTIVGVVTTNNSTDAISKITVSGTTITLYKDISTATFAGTGTEGVKGSTVTWRISA